MAKLINIFILVLSMNFVLAQESKIVKKEVLFVRHFQGGHHFPTPEDENVELDHVRHIILPYEKRPDGPPWQYGSHWRLQNYLYEFSRDPYIYLFNKIF